MYSLVTKPYLIETALFYAGTAEEVGLRGQIYRGCRGRRVLKPFYS